jgi:CubicO group peptidase (beta-lactamase class C family)
MSPRTRTEFDRLQYGYQWWLGSAEWQGREIRWSAAFGNGAQRIFVVPELDMTVVITAGAYGDVATARYVNALLRDIVETVRQ